MDTQPEITEAKVDNVVEQDQQQESEASKAEKASKENSSPPTAEVSEPPSTLPTTVIATRQRMITTQGHIREISLSQGQEVPEHYEQYQITASGDDQNVYTYEQTQGGIITISNQPESLLKRDILLEKEHNGNGPVVNVIQNFRCLTSCDSKSFSFLLLRSSTLNRKRFTSSLRMRTLNKPDTFQMRQSDTSRLTAINALLITESRPTPQRSSRIINESSR